MTNDDLLLLQTSVFTGITTDEIRDMLSCLSATTALAVGSFPAPLP